MKLPKVIDLNLTKEQKEKLAEILDFNQVQGMKGKPGMILAQVFSDMMIVGFVPMQLALKIQQTIGMKGGEITADRPRSIATKFIEDVENN